MKKRLAIIGAGFSGLSAAAYAAKAGYEVQVFERHDTPGGRARQFSTPEGYVFDMGPSWYWMPDIIEAFFADFGMRTADYFDLVSLDPQYNIVFADETLSIPQSMDKLSELFETIEAGAGMQLAKFLREGKTKYEVGMQNFVNKPFHCWTEFISPAIVTGAAKLDLLTNFRSYVAKHFRNSKLRTLMEFPVIFLGASPKNIPALYSLMNYGGYALGTHYPMGGFYQLVVAMRQIAEQQGATFSLGSDVESINVANNSVTSITVNGELHPVDAVIASADYHHTESLMPMEYRNYTEDYWEKRTFAPSCLIYYLGISERIPNLCHHTLFFENDLDIHISAIYNERAWPEKPLFYCCCPSKTDSSVAPENKENLFLLMPLANGIEDGEAKREEYLQELLRRIERHTGFRDIQSHIEYKRSYCVSDFVADYSAYGGNAYGLANTLGQTAVLKPKIKNKHLRNLYYTGQLTVPGPGVPPSIISGRIVANELSKSY